MDYSSRAFLSLYRAMHRKTKIICTIGPATNSYSAIERLYQAGMSVVRLNMSHAGQGGAADIIHWVKTLNRKVKYPVPIMLDTQGPEIRTGEVAQPLRLDAGQTVLLDASAESESAASSSAAQQSAGRSTDPSIITVNYPELPAVLPIGEQVQLDNGLMTVKVVAHHGQQLECVVVEGGELGSRKHVNLPGVAVNLPAITAKDRADIAFGLEQEIDFVALSFVRSAEDIAELRDLLGAKGGRTVKVIAKIENREGVQNAEAICRAADGVMVARGDLGIETDIAALPAVQRRLVEVCCRLGRRCIVATHLMESMIENPIPTRAEVTDVANAVYEGVDAIMLSGETGVGAHPVRCVRQLAAIAEASERERGFALHEALAIDTDKQHLATAAARLAEATGAAGIVVITRRGITADSVANCSPTVPIFAFTNLSQTRRRLMLNRSTFAHRTAFSNDPEKTIQTALRVLREREQIDPQERVVVISDVLADKTVDAIQLRTAGQA